MVHNPCYTKWSMYVLSVTFEIRRARVARPENRPANPVRVAALELQSEATCLKMSGITLQAVTWNLLSHWGKLPHGFILCYVTW